jgi:hypothetical protein
MDGQWIGALSSDPDGSVILNGAGGMGRLNVLHATPPRFDIGGMFFRRHDNRLSYQWTLDANEKTPDALKAGGPPIAYVEIQHLDEQQITGSWTTTWAEQATISLQRADICIPQDADKPLSWREFKAAMELQAFTRKVSRSSRPQLAAHDEISSTWPSRPI